MQRRATPPGGVARVYICNPGIRRCTCDRDCEQYAWESRCRDVRLARRRNTPPYAASRLFPSHPQHPHLVGAVLAHRGALYMQSYDPLLSRREGRRKRISRRILLRGINRRAAIPEPVAGFDRIRAKNNPLPDVVSVYRSLPAHTTRAYLLYTLSFSSIFSPFTFLSLPFSLALSLPIYIRIYTPRLYCAYHRVSKVGCFRLCVAPRDNGQTNCSL